MPGSGETSHWLGITDCEFAWLALNRRTVCRFESVGSIAEAWSSPNPSLALRRYVTEHSRLNSCLRSCHFEIFEVGFLSSMSCLVEVKLRHCLKVENISIWYNPEKVRFETMELHFPSCNHGFVRERLVNPVFLIPDTCCCVRFVNKPTHG